jgi:hypothetical protein
MQIVRASIVFLALLCPISSYAQTGNFFQDLAKGLEDIAKGLESISDPQKAGPAPSNSNNPAMDPADKVPLKFKNSSGHAITGFAVAKPEDAYFGDNLVGTPIQPNTTFDYQRHKDQCVLSFHVKLSNNTEKKINKLDVCSVTLVDINSSNLVRSKSARLNSVASTLQSNLGPNGNLTVAIRLANATPGCTVGDNRFRIPKSGWDIDFDNNVIIKLRAKNPEKYGSWDIYGVTQRNAWFSAKESEPVALSFVCAE